MINIGERHRLHQFLVLELAIRALQYDAVRLEQLKLQHVYLAWTNAVLNVLYPTYVQQRRQLKEQHVRVVRWRKLDQYFSEVQIATRGEDVYLRYAHAALKQEVEALLLQAFQAVSPS